MMPNKAITSHTNYDANNQIQPSPNHAASSSQPISQVANQLASRLPASSVISNIFQAQLALKQVGVHKNNGPYQGMRKVSLISSELRDETKPVYKKTLTLNGNQVLIKDKILENGRFNTLGVTSKGLETMDPTLKALLQGLSGDFVAANIHLLDKSSENTFIAEKRTAMQTILLNKWHGTTKTANIEQLPFELKTAIIDFMKANAHVNAEQNFDFFFFAKAILKNPYDTFAWVASEDIGLAIDLLEQNATVREAVMASGKRASSPLAELAISFDICRRAENKGYRNMGAFWNSEPYQNMEDALTIIQHQFLLLSRPSDKIQSLILLAQKVRWSDISPCDGKKEKIFEFFITELNAFPLNCQISVLEGIKPQSGWFSSRRDALGYTERKTLLTKLQNAFENSQSAHQKLRILGCVFDSQGSDYNFESAFETDKYHNPWFAQARATINDEQWHMTEQIKVVTGMVRHLDHLAEEEKIYSSGYINRLFSSVIKNDEPEQRKIISIILPWFASKLNDFEKGSLERENHKQLLQTCFEACGSGYDVTTARELRDKNHLGNLNLLGLSANKEMIDMHQPNQLGILKNVFAEYSHYKWHNFGTYIEVGEEKRLTPPMALVAIRQKLLVDPSYQEQADHITDHFSRFTRR